MSKIENPISDANLNKPIVGGKVIASGGYGCLFEPALKCNSGGPSGVLGDNVSKLMLTKNAKREYGEIMKYKKKLETVPNFSDYYLLEGFSLCEPAPLSAGDLIDFNKKCKALKKKKMTEKNINSKYLKKIMAMNMPNGGMNIGDYIDREKLNYDKMCRLNNSLIDLLLNGIIPMNEKGVYHCDVKEGNILVDERTGGVLKTRLIDWGLSTLYDGEKKVPKVNARRPFQFNIPFSNVLFNDTFTKMYAAFLKTTPNPSFYFIRGFVIKYVVLWIDERGPGHLKTLNAIFRNFVGKNLNELEESYRDDLIEFDYTYYFIFEYISQILFKFTRDNKFQLMEYYSEVFMKNIDVWGFVMTYVSIIEYYYDNYKNITDKEQLIIDKIKECVFLIIESSTMVIDTERLVEHLRHLNKLFKNAGKNRAPTKSKTSSSSSETKKAREKRTRTRKNRR